MAGSFDHIDNNGEFRMELIENMGDAYEALQECHAVIYRLAHGNRTRIRDAIDSLYFPDGGINYDRWPKEQDQ